MTTSILQKMAALGAAAFVQVVFMLGLVTPHSWTSANLVETYPLADVPRVSVEGRKLSIVEKVLFDIKAKLMS